MSCKGRERWVHDISVRLRMEGRDDAIAWVKVIYRFQMLIEEINFWEYEGNKIQSTFIYSKNIWDANLPQYLGYVSEQTKWKANIRKAPFPHVTYIIKSNRLLLEIRACSIIMVVMKKKGWKKSYRHLEPFSQKTELCYIN